MNDQVTANRERTRSGMEKDAARGKKEKLIHDLKARGPLLVAFSGGVDSTFLLAVAHQILGPAVTAATSTSMIHPRREMEAAHRFAQERGIQHVLVSTEETLLPAFISNLKDRCYHCKKQLISSFREIARARGLEHVAHAANLDDLADFRPGFQAAHEGGVIAPLIDAKLGKAEIRFLSREMGLPTWNKPAMACLATRIPYGEHITEEKLRMVEEAEEFLLESGFNQVRVRVHGTMARIEIEIPRMEAILEEGLRNALVRRFLSMGFEHIALDLEGHISGKMNRSLTSDEKEEPGDGLLSENGKDTLNVT
jgi:uncharacterized protein